MSQPFRNHAYLAKIDEICAMRWETSTADDLIDIAWAYSHFSIQFRENLEIACSLFPDDKNLVQLRKEECNTDNLSPWPKVAEQGERMNHDEFIRRLLTLYPIDESRRERLSEVGATYLRRVRDLPAKVRAASIASYEDDGLKKVFQAILRAPQWDKPALAAFRHFLEAHIAFDSDPEKGHGALCQHLKPDDRILPLWADFKQLFVEACPKVNSGGAPSMCASR